MGANLTGVTDTEDPAVSRAEGLARPFFLGTLLWEEDH